MFMQGILLGLLILAAISGLRVIIGPSVWDRLLGLNMVSSKLVMAIVLVACIRNQILILDLAIVYALLGFLGVTFMAIMLQKKGSV